MWDRRFRLSTRAKLGRRLPKPVGRRKRLPHNLPVSDKVSEPSVGMRRDAAGRSGRHAVTPEPL